MFVCHIAGRRQTSRQKWSVDVRPCRLPSSCETGSTAKRGWLHCCATAIGDVLAPHGIKCTRRTATLTVRARGGGCGNDRAARGRDDGERVEERTFCCCEWCDRFAVSRDVIYTLIVRL